MVNLLDKLNKFNKFGEEIKSILKLRNKFVQHCSQKLKIKPDQLIWSSVIAPSLLMSLILSNEFKKNQDKRIHANCLIDLCHLYFALNDRIKDKQVTTQAEIKKHENTARVFRCVYDEILDDSKNQGMISKDQSVFFKNFFENLLRHAKKKVYPKDEEIKVKNLTKKIVNEELSGIFNVKEILEVHETKFGNFFRGMGYYLFKFLSLNFENNRAYFDLFFNIGMLAQLVDDLRDFFWQDIEIEQPNMVAALLVHETWDVEGKKLKNLLMLKNERDNDQIKRINASLHELRHGNITVYEFYERNFPETYKFIKNLTEKYETNIKKCLEELKIDQLTANEIVDVYGVIIPFIKSIMI